MNEQSNTDPAPESPPVEAAPPPVATAVPAGVGRESLGYDASTAERIEGEFTEVEAALIRLDESRYGICEVTGERIADELLAADPVRRHHTTTTG
ncbi:MAG: hypothetical protein GY929_11160 [Actinomycetia bacterium]|nr:hypothetical protein [Actinomycetes bacterium]